MNGFTPIDLDFWPRKEYYLHFINDVVCTYSMTADLDITALAGHRLHPAMLWLLTDTVNQYPEFRTHLSQEHGLGIFDEMHPSYTIFNKDNENFSVVWTEFSKDYPTFLARYTADVAAYEGSTCFMPKTNRPSNLFDVSMLPWTSFTSFNINVYDEGKYLLPIFTMGRKFDRDGKTLLPLAVQVHHAVCDGFHVSRFKNTLQEKINNFQ